MSVGREGEPGEQGDQRDEASAGPCRGRRSRGEPRPQGRTGGDWEAEKVAPVTSVALVKGEVC